MENFHFLRTKLISILRILVKILSIVSTPMVVMNSNVNVTKDLMENDVTRCVLWIVELMGAVSLKSIVILVSNSRNAFVKKTSQVLINNRYILTSKSNI